MHRVDIDFVVVIIVPKHHRMPAAAGRGVSAGNLGGFPPGQRDLSEPNRINRDKAANSTMSTAAAATTTATITETPKTS